MTTAAWSPNSGRIFDPGLMSPSGFSARKYLRSTSGTVKHDPLVLARQTTTRAIQRLRSLDDNWDGLGSAKPNEAAIANAVRAVPELINAAESAGGWSLPNTTANDVGEVVLEWWAGENKLTLFVRPDGIDFLRAWGEDVMADMEDGELAGGSFATLWAWLLK